MTNSKDLATRVAELEAENAALRADRRSSVQGKRRRGMSVAAASLIIVGLVLGTAGIIVSSVKSQMLNTDRFVSSFAPLAEDPEVQAVVVDGVMDAIDGSVDIPALTAPVFDGIESLGLPPRAASALSLLQTPVNQGLRSFVETQVDGFVTSPAFADIWATTLRTTHGQLISTLQGASNAAVSIDRAGTLSLELGPVIGEIRTRLIANGMGFAEAIPEVNRSITIVESSSLASLPSLYALTVAVGDWLPWLALALIVGGILLAANRRRAIIATSIATAVLMLVPGIALLVARITLAPLFLSSDSSLTIGALHTLYDAATSGISETILAVGTLAIIVALAAWLSGSTSFPQALRRTVGNAAASVRASGERHGLTTGRFGAWLGRHHLLVMIGIGVVAATVVVLQRPVTLGIVIPVVLIAALAVLLVPFLSRTGAASEPSTVPAPGLQA